MAKHRGLRTGEPETDLTFRTNVYPLQHKRSEQLRQELEAVVDLGRCSLKCLLGEVHIRHLSYSYAARVRVLLEGRRFLEGKITLRKVK
ncbi:MAG: hypothetical protein Q7S29_05440 [Candidatus Peribacter sp.]|nr:hypothetical protein [Candidatus Peribacter sp.]